MVAFERFLLCIYTSAKILKPNAICQKPEQASVACVIAKQCEFTFIFVAWLIQHATNHLQFVKIKNSENTHHNLNGFPSF